MFQACVCILISISHVDDLQLLTKKHPTVRVFFYIKNHSCYVLKINWLKYVEIHQMKMQDMKFSD